MPSDVQTDSRSLGAYGLGMVLNGNDREVIEACKRGDHEAFTALFEANRDRVFSIALRFAGDRAAAMDISQDAFLKVMSRIGEFRGESSFETWLYRLVVNSCIDHQRKGRRLIQFVEDVVDAIRPARDTVLQELLRAEMQSHVQRVVSLLRPEHRIVIVLRYTEELSYEEISEILGVSLGTVASRLNRAHKVLERRLAHLRGIGDCGVS